MKKKKLKHSDKIENIKAVVVKKPPKAGSDGAEWESFPPFVALLHHPFCLAPKKHWSKPRQPGLDLSDDDNSRVFTKPFGHAIEKSGVFEHAETNDLRLEVLFIIQEIARRAAIQEQTAGEALATVTRRAVRELDAIALRFPESLKPIARTQAQWPAFISPHPEFAERNQSLLSKLEVGEDAEVHTYSKAKWRSNNPATSCVLSLIDYIRSKQDQLSELNVLRAAQKDFPEMIVEGPKYPPWVKKCGELPPLHTNTLDQWWIVAKEAFLEGVPHPENIPELRRLAITPNFKKALYDSEIRSLILRRLKAALKGIVRE